MISMTLDKDNEVAVQTMKLLVLISKWVISKLFLFFVFFHFQSAPLIILCIKPPVTPQIIWWCSQSRGLQAAPPVCLLITAPSCGHCRRAAPLKVHCPSCTKNMQTKNVKNKQGIQIYLDVVGIFSDLSTLDLLHLILRRRWMMKRRVNGKRLPRWRLCCSSTRSLRLQKTDVLYTTWWRCTSSWTYKHGLSFCLSPPAAQACGVPGGQPVGLCWSPAQGLACTHISTAARRLLTHSR